MTPSQPVSTVAAVSVEVSPSVLKEAAVSVAPSRPSPAANPVPAPATVSAVTAVSVVHVVMQTLSNCL